MRSLEYNKYSNNRYLCIINIYYFIILDISMNVSLILHIINSFIIILNTEYFLIVLLIC